MVVGLCAVTACSSDGGNDNPFGVGTSATATATATATGSSGGGSSSGSGDGTGSDGSTGSPTTGSPSTGPDPSTTAADDSTGAGDTIDPSAGVQPMDGMYSPCTTGMECGNTPILCITINDADGNPTDGFCSQTPCANPAVDCLPSPGGTAVPTCMPVTVDGAASMACALDCAGGATCPTGMTCYSLEVGSVCG